MTKKELKRKIKLIRKQSRDLYECEKKLKNDDVVFIYGENADIVVNHISKILEKNKILRIIKDPTWKLDGFYSYAVLIG